MPTELQRRKEAIRLHLYQGLSKAEVCRHVGKGTSWLDRWLSRYDPDNVDESLSDRSPGPQRKTYKWDEQIRQQVIEMRKLRENRELFPYALVGAAAIHYELKALETPEVPPIRTIHYWLAAEGLIGKDTESPEKKPSKPIPLPQAQQVNSVHQLDLKGPVYLRGNSHKHYLAMLRDRYSRRIALVVLTSREAAGIVDFVVDSWKWMGIPDYLQLDNALEFRGSNRYPRSFGRLVRVATDIGMEPIFVPPHEPWRNGCIERQNRFLDERLLAVEHEHLDAFCQETLNCRDACNQTHRLEVLDGLTPDEMIERAALRLLPSDYTRHKNKKLLQNKGFVSFVRLIRKSGRITLGAGDRFMIDPEKAHTYVLARVDLAQKKVVISQNDETLKIYDFSRKTVGHWAKDKKKDLSDEKDTTRS